MNTSTTVRFSTPALVVAFVGLAACREVIAPDRASAPDPRFEAAPVVALERFYGPERFTRTRGAPDEFTRTISTLRFEAPFILHVKNGAADGSRRAFAAVVALDEKVLLSENDFARHTEWAIPVTPGMAAVLAVSVRGAPDAFIGVWLEGKRSDPVFCPDGPPGTYPTLPEAIAAARMGGTVLVCDGEHVIDRVSVSKPLTIRSQNPGGATLADADPNPRPQAGLPALLVENVASGTVRIADLSFLLRGRGIVARGTFDQLELDSLRFTGRNAATSYAVWIEESTVASAKVNVSRSAFVSLQVGVFALGHVESNVRSSTFDGFAPSGVNNGGAVTYSGRVLATGPSSSFGTAENNTFANCSITGCIRVVGPAQAGNEITITGNRMPRQSGPSQIMAIFVGRTSANSTPLGQVIVADNELAGTHVSGDVSVAGSWSVQTFIRTSGGPGGAHVLVRGNIVAGVHTGIWAATSTTARDNAFATGYHAVSQRNPSVRVDFQRNDVQGYHASIFRVEAGGDPGNYRCNWWSSSSGPAFPNEHVTPDSYTPWATQPIAGRAGVSCP